MTTPEKFIEQLMKRPTSTPDKGFNRIANVIKKLGLSTQILMELDPVFAEKNLRLKAETIRRILNK